MSIGFPVPRSGRWQWSSKSDRRWNLRGSYRAFEPDHGSLIPVEAIRARDALSKDQGQEPPADLVCVTLPFPSPKLRRRFEANLLETTESLGALEFLAVKRGISSLNMDLATGELAFSRHGRAAEVTLPAQWIGTLNLDDARWRWAWADDEQRAVNPELLRAADAVRESGREGDVAELCDPEIELGTTGDRPWFSGDYLASAVSGPGDFYLGAQNPEAPQEATYWLVHAPDTVADTIAGSTRMAHVIHGAMSRWSVPLEGVDGRPLVRDYAVRKQARVIDVDDHRIAIEVRDGGKLFVDFTDSGAVQGIELPQAPAPAPRPPSWLERLTGRRRGT